MTHELTFDRDYAIAQILKFEKAKVVKFQKAADDSDLTLSAAKRGAPPIFNKRIYLAEIMKRSDAKRQPGETREQAFAKFITEDDDGKALYRTFKQAEGPDHEVMASNSSFMPMQSAPALARLTKLAEQLRAEDPSLSEAQAFAKVYTSPANAELVAAEREERRSN
jgi:hypothetical protein